jgi:hypothetical protein
MSLSFLGLNHDSQVGKSGSEIVHPATKQEGREGLTI